MQRREHALDRHVQFIAKIAKGFAQKEADRKSIHFLMRPACLLSFMGMLVVERETFELLLFRRVGKLPSSSSSSPA
jgi:phosphopantetheinyl transferase (holo-ACP synthase)